MEKIRNKKFIDFLRSQDKEIQAKRKDATRGDVLKSFENNIEKLETLVEKRINNKKDEDSGPYNNIKFLLRRYINATKFKFIDLTKGLISCVNSGSYSGALVISRTILENVAMLDLKRAEFNKLLINKKYLKLLKELLMVNVKDYQTYKVKDYKRTHINDALRHYNKKDRERDIFKIYNPISERVHPSPSSFLMYQEIMTIKESYSQVSFSHNSQEVQGAIFGIIGLMLTHISIIVEDHYPLIKKELIDILENYKLPIEVYFQNNISDSEEHDKLLKYFNTK
jgi:hypothetical protein